MLLSPFLRYQKLNLIITVLNFCKLTSSLSWSSVEINESTEDGYGVPFRNIMHLKIVVVLGYLFWKLLHNLEQQEVYWNRSWQVKDCLSWLLFIKRSFFVLRSHLFPRSNEAVMQQAYYNCLLVKNKTLKIPRFTFTVSLQHSESKQSLKGTVNFKRHLRF